MSRSETDIRRELQELELKPNDAIVRQLVLNIEDSETIVQAAEGYQEEALHRVVLVLTDRSAICVRKEGTLFPQYIVHKLWWRDIATVEASVHNFLNKIRLVPFGSTAHEIRAEIHEKFAERYRNIFQEAQTRVSRRHPEPDTSDDDLVSQLERLAQLRESGVLTDEELRIAKARLLNP